MPLGRCFIALLFSVAISGCNHASQKNEVIEATQGPACPARDFPTFLRAFSASEDVRSRFTAHVVRDTDWRDVDDFDKGVETTAVAKDQYHDFTLRYMGGSFHHAASDGTVDPTILDVAVKNVGGGFRVSYTYGMSEGNSWLFERVGKCWQLTADPEPPAE